VLRDLLVTEIGFDVSCSTVDRALDKLDLTLKKRRSMPTKKKVSVSCSSV
jgi:transposase